MWHRRDIMKATAAWALGTGALAQSPGAPALRILVGAPAGGTTDAMARILAPALSQALGRPVLVENRPGAGGNLAAEAVARAAPDGQTLLMSFTSHAINASLYPSLPFDPLRDFTPLTLVATSPSMLVAHPSLPVTTVPELIALARRQPDRLNFAVGAMGSSLQLAGDAFKMQAGVQVTNIPYRGTAPALQDVLAGQVGLMFAAVGNVQSHVRAGKLRALAVTSRKRLAAFPEVPAIAETLPGYESSAWFGLFGPARLPVPVVQCLVEAVHAALQSPDIRRRIEGEGAQAISSNPDDFSRFVQAEVARWREVVVFSGAKAE